MDNVRIYNRALSEDEVAALYELENQPPFNLEEGLVAYYPFNGNANDESGNGNDGEVSGATLGDDRHGNSNSAYQFDGNQNHIRVSHSTSLNFEAENSFSVSAWISPHSLSGPHNLILSKQTGAGSSQDGWNVSIQTNHWIDIRVQNGRGQPQATFTGRALTLLPNNYYHVIHTYNNGKGSIFINGQLVFSNTTPPDSAFVGDNSSDLLIGRPTWNAPEAKAFNGIIDDVRIYNRALSEAEVTALYELERTPLPSRFTFKTPKMNSDGNLILKAKGPANSNVTYQFTYDLINWRDQFTLPMTNGESTITLPVPKTSQDSQFFYRLKLAE